MLYNSAISYNQPFIRYNGILIINVPGISNPIIINEVNLLLELKPDYSNNTTIGILTLESESTGIITFDLTASQTALVSQSIDQAQNYAEITLDFI